MGRYHFSVSNPGAGVRYYALAQLGEGGYGEVWSGVSCSGVPVAIKLFKTSPDPDGDFRRWHNEQTIGSRCRGHPHIVTMYDRFWTQEGHLVIVMEKADGSLEDHIRDYGPLDPSWVCLIGLHVLDALRYIHGMNVVHRDVTLGNVLWFEGGVYKLADFGIAKGGVAASEIARTFIGNRPFIPPELHAFRCSTHQSDLYQLGMVLLALLAGRCPVPQTASAAQVRKMILQGLPRRMAEGLVADYGSLARTISIMLRRRLKWRHASADQVTVCLRDELRRRQSQ